MLLQLGEAEIMSLPLIDELVGRAHGTLILWQDFDRLGAGEPSLERALGNRMDLARDHLALVFHRFLSAAVGAPPVVIAINRNPGYTDAEEYARAWFRVTECRYYCVRDGFPRIVRDGLAAGVTTVSYEIDLQECGPFACGF
jgi:hypothetical protein